jgi:putative endonuclease
VFYVYVLFSQKTGRRYTGSCQDLVERVHYHNDGHVKSTRHGIRWQVIYAEQFATRTDAVRRERYFKTGIGREELDHLLQQGECKSIVEDLNRAVAQSG